MESIPADQAPKPRRPMIKRHWVEGGRGEIYPYDEWCDGQWHRATKGQDFDTRSVVFYNNLRRWAKTNGDITFEGRASGDEVLFKLGPLTEEQRSTRSFYLTAEEYAEYLRTRPKRQYGPYRS